MAGCGSGRMMKSVAVACSSAASCSSPRSAASAHGGDGQNTIQAMCESALGQTWLGWDEDSVESQQEDQGARGGADAEQPQPQLEQTQIGAMSSRPVGEGQAQDDWQPRWCEVCDMWLSEKWKYERHLCAFKHNKNLLRNFRLNMAGLTRARHWRFWRRPGLGAGVKSLDTRAANMSNKE